MPQLEIRNPNKLTIVTKALLKAHPEWVEPLGKFYDLRAERGLDNTFKAQVEASGSVHTPLFIAQVPDVGDVVIAGRQRTRAAVALGFTSVPVIVINDETEIVKTLELTENLARSENSLLENAAAFKSALAGGMSMEKVAALAGVSHVTIANTLYLAEMPSFIHDDIDKGKISAHAALQLRSFGKKAAKHTGVSKVYDKESQDQMKEAIATMSEEAKLKGNGKGGKVSIKQAKESTSKSAEGLSGKEWDELVAADDVPSEYKLLIQVFRNKISWQSARRQDEVNLSWLSKREPTPKPPKEKKQKVSKKKVEVKEEEAKPTKKGELDFDPAELFGNQV